MMTDGDEFSLCEEVDFHVSYQSLKMSMEDDQKDADFPVSFEDFEQVIMFFFVSSIYTYKVGFFFSASDFE